jgi:TnpA family transposase
MAHRSLLSLTEIQSLRAFPEDLSEIIRYYTLSESDLELIHQHRGDASRFGFAFLLCAMRYPGVIMHTFQSVPVGLGKYLEQQLAISANVWKDYAKRPTTRWEHLQELQKVFGFKSFNKKYYQEFLEFIIPVALQTDKAFPVAEFLIETLRSRKILLPSEGTIDRICSEAVFRAKQEIYRVLIENLTGEQLLALDKLLEPHEKHKQLSCLTWILYTPLSVGPKHILEHLNRLKVVERLKLPSEQRKKIHRNWLIKLIREGQQMTTQHLRDLEPMRRRATLVAVCINARASIIDTTVEWHDRYIRKLFRKARQNYEEELEDVGRSAGELLREFSKVINVLLQANQDNQDLREAIESVTTWENLSLEAESVSKLGQSQSLNYLAGTEDYYNVIRRYAPAMLEAFSFQSRPSHSNLLAGLELLKRLNRKNSRKIPKNAPTAFIPARWRSLVIGEKGLDRHFYELCILFELKNALRSGNLWIEGSSQYRDFEDYLLPLTVFDTMKKENKIPISVSPDCESYLENRFAYLSNLLSEVTIQGKAGLLVDAEITKRGFKISPLKKDIPEDAKALQRQLYSALPKIRITDLLLEVEQWTNFGRAFVHIKDEKREPDKLTLLTVILSDGLNFGLRKMAESCPGMTYNKISWTQSWYVREETYTGAQKILVDIQHIHPFAGYWGNGTTSSSDGQWFSTSGHARAEGEINAQYGFEPGKMLYTHISDQNMPFHTKIVSPLKRDYLYVVDGILYHNTSLDIKEHYTDTSGSADHIFAILHFIGCRFAPRIRDFKDRKLYIPKEISLDNIFDPVIGGYINTEIIRKEWDEILRFIASLRNGSDIASALIYKLSNCSPKNSLNKALQELGKIERTLFMLDWVKNPELRRTVQVGLNKGEARNALARSIFENNRGGELHDRTRISQQNRASGLNLMIAAISLWNTVYLEKIVEKLEKLGHKVNKDLLSHVSPLGWNHILLNGDFIWKPLGLKEGEFRPLRPLKNAEWEEEMSEFNNNNELE